MNEREKRIQEQRTIEATRKDLMGLTGKIGTVLRNLGQPLIEQSQGGTFMDSSYLDDPWALPSENSFGELKEGTADYVQSQIPYMELDSEGTQEPTDGAWRDQRDYEMPLNSTSQIGWYFDGLSSGVHMEIKYDEHSKNLTLTWKGYLVYKESSGELAAYTPSEEWESKINYLYQHAIKKEKSSRKEQRKDDLKQAEKVKSTWLEKMRERWGL